MNKIRSLFLLIISVGFILSLETKFGDIPPLGKFLNPVSGFWINAENKQLPPINEIRIDSLLQKANIFYDKHRIPHIFAQNEHDLYFAQGYITAKDRLFQMDIQTRLASGRLAEIVGIKALPLDLYHRRMGMVYGAENALKGMMKDPEMRKVVEAYTEGVNSYIKSLNPKHFPIEFKLLDYAPEEFKPINCAFLLKLMSETLASGSSQVSMTNNLNYFGSKVTEDLFPDNPFHQEPIIPKGTPWDFKSISKPAMPKKTPIWGTDTNKPPTLKEGIGSNNWAISGSKTLNGFPILANDPHLTLSLPSIWYEIQLNCPKVNVYGVSIPGSPCVIIGFNNQVSWGMTNVDADVLDWYHIRFKDKNKNEYWYRNHWNKVSKRVEVIKVLGQNPILDTVIYTHQGPVVYSDSLKKPKSKRLNIPIGDALRWVAHDESNDLKTFYYLNKAQNFNDYRKALAFYTAPAQNFVFASNDKDIAISPNGKFPLKYKDQGKYILDGSDPSNDWQGWIPSNQNPMVRNPSRGFVSSANQTSTDTTYPYYINWQFGGYERGKRINDQLSSMKKATVETLSDLQMDNYSIHAQDILGVMLRFLNTKNFNPAQKHSFQILQNWDKHFRAGSIGATLFNTWWKTFYYLVWDDEFGNISLNLRYPSRDRTEKLLIQDTNSHWFDNIHTAQKESCRDIVNESFMACLDTLTKHYGNLGASWAWGKVKQTYLNHLANIPGLGIENFEADGNAGVINALRDDDGPSWRMVVQMGYPVKGYGIFPGGESGNPGSYFYDDLFKTWKEGKLDELIFIHSEKEAAQQLNLTLILNPH